MGPRAGLDGRKISSPPGSIPDRPARSQSLYRLSYPARMYQLYSLKMTLEGLKRVGVTCIVNEVVIKDCMSAFIGVFFDSLTKLLKFLANCSRNNIK